MLVNLRDVEGFRGYQVINRDIGRIFSFFQIYFLKILEGQKAKKLLFWRQRDDFPWQK